jgi:secreted PhoX family phosphatase
MGTLPAGPTREPHRFCLTVGQTAFMDRRRFLHRAIASGTGAALLPSVAMAGATPRRSGQAGVGPYGTIEGRSPDANGLVLPEGFTSRVVGVAGEPVDGTDYPWHVFPDGAATFDDGDGGWHYVCNSEVFLPPGLGGASAIHFGPDGEVKDARRVLEGTTANCAGGPTPWGTWLSGEERLDGRGQVWECDPTGARPGEVRPALGRWAHEAVAVDPDGGALYLTEDDRAGRLYRFTPDDYPDLTSGSLHAAAVAADGSVTWLPIDDPEGDPVLARDQAPSSTVFPGAEGIWFHDGSVIFTTKHDNRVHAIDLSAQRHTLLWDAAANGPSPALTGVDNVTVATGSGDVFVAEDGGNMEVVLITPDGEVVPFARVAGDGHATSEVTGPVFNPAGDRLYFSSQRGPSPRLAGEILGVPDALNGQLGGGVTWEVTGPFRRVEGAASPSTTIARAGSGGASGGTEEDDSSVAGPELAAGVGAAALAAGGAAWWLRRRRSAAGLPADRPTGDRPDGPAA